MLHKLWLHHLQTACYGLAHPTEFEQILYIISLQHTYGWYSHHSSIAAPIAVGSHNTDSVSHIVGYSDWNTCSTGGDWTEAWTDSDGVVDWNPTIILWGQPLHYEGYIVPTILLNSGGGSSGRRGETCWGVSVSVSVVALWTAAEKSSSAQ